MGGGTEREGGASVCLRASQTDRQTYKLVDISWLGRVGRFLDLFVPTVVDISLSGHLCVLFLSVPCWHTWVGGGGGGGWAQGTRKNKPQTLRCSRIQRMCLVGLLRSLLPIPPCLSHFPPPSFTELTLQPSRKQFLQPAISTCPQWLGGPRRARKRKVWGADGLCPWDCR